MQEIDFYKEWCLITNDYLCNRSLQDNGEQIVNSEFKAKMLHEYEKIRMAIIKFYQKGNLRMLKKYYGYQNETLPEPGDSDYPTLNARLLAACGKGLDDLYKKRWERIAKIKERGKIRSDSEFYLIQEHIDYLINMEAPEDEVKLFDSMLSDYEERARKRREKRYIAQ